jgi:hypothetical protein
MAIGRISGSMLVSNLDRQGTDLQFTTGGQPLYYMDFSQFRVGINTNVTPQTLTIAGNLSTSNIVISGNSITTKNGEAITITGNVSYNIGNLNIGGGSNGYVISTNGSGALSWQNFATLSNSQGFYGNAFVMGTAAAGSTSNALTFSSTTSVTDGIASLNSLLGNITDNNGTLIHVAGNVTAGNVNSRFYGDINGNIIGTTGAFTSVSGTLTTSAQTNITSVGTLTSLAVTGNITAGNVNSTFYGDQFGNSTGTNGSFTNVTGTLQTAAQPNVTSLGTLTGLVVTGNVTAGNVAGEQFSGNIVGTTGKFSGNVNTNNVIGTIGDFTSVTGTLQTSAQPNITSVGTLGSLAVTGNVTAAHYNGMFHGNVVGATGLFSSNVTSTGYIAFGLNADLMQAGVLGFVNDSYGFTTQYNSAVIVTNQQGLTTQTLFLGDTSTSNNSTLMGVSVNNVPVLNLTGTGNLAVTGNVYASNFIGTQFNGSVVGTVTGNISGTTASFNSIAGTLTTAAQPNVTSLGTLTSLAVTGNVTAGNVNSTVYGDVHTNNISGINGNLTITVPSNSVAVFSSDQAVKLPIGNSYNRPVGAAGYIRYNTDTLSVEYYDGTSWVPVTNKVTSQTFNGDGVNNSYVLTHDASVESLLVTINGTVQQNGAYTVSGGQITFAEVPLVTDAINIRYLGGVTSFSGVVSNDLTIQGNLTLSGILSAPQTTKASNATGTPGQVCWDANYIYVCTAPNTWKRSPLTGGY